MIKRTLFQGLPSTFTSYVMVSVIQKSFSRTGKKIPGPGTQLFENTKLSQSCYYWCRKPPTFPMPSSCVFFHLCCCNTAICHQPMRRIFTVTIQCHQSIDFQLNVHIFKSFLTSSEIRIVKQALRFWHCKLKLYNKTISNIFIVNIQCHLVNQLSLTGPITTVAINGFTNSRDARQTSQLLCLQLYVCQCVVYTYAPPLWNNHQPLSFVIPL